MYVYLVQRYKGRLQYSSSELQTLKARGRCSRSRDVSSVANLRGSSAAGRDTPGRKKKKLYNNENKVKKNNRYEHDSIRIMNEKLGKNNNNTTIR
jgi:hypothetical protein